MNISKKVLYVLGAGILAVVAAFFLLYREKESEITELETYDAPRPARKKRKTEETADAPPVMGDELLEVETENPENNVSE